MKSKGILITVAAVIAILIYGGMYTVDETEQVVITQFGRIVGSPKIKPGLKFKLPFVQTANRFPKNLRLTWLVVGLVLIMINSILALNWTTTISRTGQQYSQAPYPSAQQPKSLGAYHRSTLLRLILRMGLRGCLMGWVMGCNYMILIFRLFMVNARITN